MAVYGACVVLLLELCVASKPEDWFLSAVEISGETSGRDRSLDVNDYPGLAAWTSGNKVDFIPDGRTFFRDVKREMDASRSGDEIYGAGWTFSAKTDLLAPEGVFYDCVDDHSLDGLCDTFGFCSLAGFPLAQKLDANHTCCKDPLNEKCASVEGVFSRAAKRGATIRVLSWNNAVPGTNGGTLLQYSQAVMNDAFFQDANSKSVVVLDGRTIGMTSSIHQKFFAFLRPDRAPVAFVSGIDLGNCRMDTSDAVLGKGFRRLSIIEQCGGWLDQGMRIEGPAAIDVANTFVQRWNWKASLDAKQYHPSADKFNNRWNVVLPTATMKAKHLVGSDSHTQHVQVLRTYSCGQQGPYAPCGEFTVMAAILKAISMAKRYVFIEDQYGFNTETVRDALQEAVGRGVKVIAVINMYGAEFPTAHCAGSGGHMWNCLRQDGAAVFEYNMEKHGDYIHSKTWIVDDCWFMTGSANLNWRSMSNDEELNAAVMDKSCMVFNNSVHEKNFVKKARCEMWAELTNVEGHTAAQICDMADKDARDIDALVKTIFGTSWVPVASKLSVLGTSTGTAASISNWACQATDPDGRCKSEPCFLTHDSFSQSSTTHTNSGRAWCPERRIREYLITVQTADGWFYQGFGTDSDVDLRITGSHGSTGWFRLNRLQGGWNFFEDGYKDKFRFKTCDVGRLVKVELDFYNNYPASGWCLEYIEVQGCGRWKYRGWLNSDTRIRARKPSFTCDGSTLDRNGNYNGADKDKVEYTCSGGAAKSERECSAKPEQSSVASKATTCRAIVRNVAFALLSFWLVSSM